MPGPVQWLIDNLTWIVPLLLILSSLLNMTTRYYTQYTGLARVLTHLAEVFSFLASLGSRWHPSWFGKLKLPIIQLMPPRDEFDVDDLGRGGGGSSTGTGAGTGGRRGSYRVGGGPSRPIRCGVESMLYSWLLVPLLGLLLLSVGGSGCRLSAKTVEEALSLGQTGVEASWGFVHPPTDAACAKLAEACKGKVSKPTDCKPWVTCWQLRELISAGHLEASCGIAKMAEGARVAIKLGIIKGEAKRLDGSAAAVCSKAKTFTLLPQPASQPAGAGTSTSSP